MKPKMKASPKKEFKPKPWLVKEPGEKKVMIYGYVKAKNKAIAETTFNDLINLKKW